MIKATAEAKKIRCLVIQLGRLGDTLQSLMALRAAQQLYPQLEIHLVARENFSEAAKRVTWLKSVQTFPTEDILGPVLSHQGSEKDALKDIARWVRPLVQEAWDIAFNWTYSEASSYLMGLIPSKVKLGYSRSKTIEFSCPDGWSHYIQAIVQGGVLQNIHLTDILTTQLLTALQIHAGEPADNGDAPVTSKDFFELSHASDIESKLGSRWRDRSKKWVSIHTDSSRSLESWTELADQVLIAHPEFGVILLGDDQVLGNNTVVELQKRGRNLSSIITLAGRDNFDLLAAAVGRSQWLISAEASSIHLASVLGTRILATYKKSTRWLETGPYGNGHYVASATSGEWLSAELIAQVWSYALQDSTIRKHQSLEQFLSKSAPSLKTEGLRVYRSKIRSSADGGGVVYEPNNSQALELDDWTSMVMGHIARAWYCGWVPTLGKELSRNSITPHLIRSLRDLQESADVLSKICDEATLTATRLSRQSSKLRSKKIMRMSEKEELQTLAKKLQDLDSLIERMGKTQAPLEAFSRMCKILLGNLKSTDITDLGFESAECYRQLQEGIVLLREWIKFTLELARPVALRREGATGLSLVTQPQNPKDI